MKNIKKISVALLPLIAFIGVFLLQSPNAKAFVATTPDQIKNASFNFVNRGLIQVKIGGQVVDFVDGKPFDPGLKFVAQNYDCDSSIDLPNDPFALYNLGSYPTTLDTKYINIKYNDGSGSGCKSADVAKAPTGINVGMRTWFEWTDATTIKRVDGASTFTKAPSNDYYLDTGEDGKNCQDRIFVNGTNVQYFQLDSEKYNDPSKTDVKSYTLSGCKIYDLNMQNAFTDKEINDAFSHPITLGASENKSKPAGSSVAAGTGAAQDDDSSACVASGGTGLEWLLCPLTTTLGKAVDKIDDLINSQLHYDVNGNLPDNQGVHIAWSLIKNIASVILVIVMLVMVISQAIGGALFDAYTVRKLLPRLVIAVIAMQLSWVLCKYAISLANDAGEGLGQLMAAPFGGGGNLDLSSILHRLSPAEALASTVTVVGILVGGVVLGAIFLPGALVLGFSLFLGAVMALVMLMFRNVLIVALVMFSPLAILAWMMPNQGLQKYWKFWSDNFIKLLMLFPLIVAIIYTGRIFAWTVAGSNQGSPGFIDYATILVAYFGPYFLIPKAFKWGGSLMSAAGSAVGGARKQLQGWANKPITTLADRAQGKLAEKYAIASKSSRDTQHTYQKSKDKADKARARIQALKDAGKDTTQREALLKQREAQVEKNRLAAVTARKDGRLQRAAYRVTAGKPLPTKRQQLETIAKGSAYKKELVDMEQALIHTDFVEHLNAGNSVGDSKKYIRDKYHTENLLRDASGNLKLDENGYAQSKDKFRERAFLNWMVDTRSAKEMGEEDWMTDGGRITEINKSKDWMGMMNADPQRYAYISQNYSIMQPFYQDGGGGPKRKDFTPAVQDTAGATVAAGGSKSKGQVVTASSYMAGGTHAALNPTNDPVRALELAQEEARNIGKEDAEDARYVRWLTQMEEDSKLATERGENFEILNEIVKSQKARGKESEAAKLLDQKLKELRALRSPEAQSILTKLLGGRSGARKGINGIFADESSSYLEDLLQVPPNVAPVRTSPPIPQSSLPTSFNLSIPANVEGFKQRLVQGPYENNATAQELAHVLSESPRYARENHATSKNEYKLILDELHDSSASNRSAAISFNAILDDTLARIEGRVQDIVQKAVSEGRSDDEIKLISERARAAANSQREEYERLRLVPPSDSDPSLLHLGKQA